MSSAPAPERARCGCDKLSESLTYRETYEKPPFGCGAEWEVGHMFRCIDCGLLLCRGCMRQHCAKDRSLTMTYLRMIRDHKKVANADIEWAAHIAEVALKELGAEA